MNELVIILIPLLYILVKEGTPINNEKTVGVILRPRNTTELTGGDNLTHEDGGAAFYTLATIIGELHIFLVELDTVTVDAKHTAGSHDVIIETFFLQCVVLSDT